MKEQWSRGYLSLTCTATLSWWEDLGQQIPRLGGQYEAAQRLEQIFRTGQGRDNPSHAFLCLHSPQQSMHFLRGSPHDVPIS